MMFLSFKIFLATIITVCFMSNILTNSSKLLKSMRHQVKHLYRSFMDTSESNILDNLTMQDGRKMQLLVNGSTDKNIELSENSVLLSQTEILENASNIIGSRNYSSEIIQGVWEGIVAEIVATSFNEQEGVFTAYDTVHLAMKSLLLDMLMNTATLFLPKLQTSLLKVSVLYYHWTSAQAMPL